MASEWKVETIEEIAEKVGMGPFGSSIKVSTFVDSGVPIISGQHLNEAYVTDDDHNFITEEHAEKLKGANVFRGDVILTHAGNIGQVSYIPNDSKYAKYVISQRQFYIRCAKGKADPRFLTYYLRSPEGQHKVLANRSSSGVPSIARPVTYIKSVTVPVPDLKEQRRVADVLGALDDKIKLNRQMNRTLEAMARAIFKAWFVDFEPVKAKAAGATCFRGMPQEVFGQLPDRFAESELGPVPEGWEVVSLDKLMDINPKRSLGKGEVAPYLAMSDMPTQGHHPDSWGIRPFGSGVKFRNGDTLIARITPCLENGKTAFVDFLQEGEVGWGSTEYIVLRPKSPLPKIYAYCFARSPGFREFAIANMTGTSGRQRVPASAIASFRSICPPEPLATTFAGIAEPLFEMVAGNHKVTRALTSIRDVLLPKLISGEIRVPEAWEGADGG